MIDQRQRAGAPRLAPAFLAAPGPGTTPDPGLDHEMTDRVFRALVDTPPRHDALLRTVDGQDRAGDRDAVETYLRDAGHAGDAGLGEALAGHSADDIDRVQLIGAILDRAGTGSARCRQPRTERGRVVWPAPRRARRCERGHR